MTNPLQVSLIVPQGKSLGVESLTTEATYLCPKTGETFTARVVARPSPPLDHACILHPAGDHRAALYIARAK